jgi:hypothetical protein
MKQTLIHILKYNFIPLNSLHSIEIKLRKKSINYYVENILNYVIVRLILIMTENI